MRRVFDAVVVIIFIIVVVMLLVKVAYGVYILTGGPCTSNALCAP